jgi:hypothetical protein
MAVQVAAGQVTPHGGQVVKFRNHNRTEHMRLLMDATVRATDTGPWLTLWGYRTRADGLPTHVRAVARHLPAAEVEIVPPEVSDG